MSNAISKALKNHLDDWRVLLAAYVLGNAGLLMIYLLPLLVGAVVEGMNLNEQQAGVFASSDLIGYSMASISAFFWIRKANWRYVAILGLGIMILGNVLSPYMSSFYSLITMRLLTGMGQGITVALTLAVIGDATKTDRNFAIYLIISLLFGAVCVELLPAWVESFSNPSPIYYAQVLFSILALPIVLFIFPTKGLDYEEEGLSGKLSFPVLLALAGVLILFAGYGGLWSMAERIGDISGLDAEFIGRALAISLIVAIFALLVPIIFGTRFGRLLPIGISLLSLIAFGIILFWNSSQTAYLLAVCLGSFGINMILPYITGVIGEHDQTGKAVIMVTPMYSIGFALGPAALSLFVSEGNYAPLGYAAAFIFLICFGVYWWIIQLHKMKS